MLPSYTLNAIPRDLKINKTNTFKWVPFVYFEIFARQNVKMSKFNFDSEFFRRVISKCEKTKKLPPLSRTVQEAVELFYEEYDYYPDLAVYAPGSFTIMGDHLEYVKGNLVQAALPLGTVIVGKSLCSVKCKLYTSSKNVEGLRKSVFPISHYKKNLKVFPEWVNYIKGVINVFSNQNINGFNAVIHSNVPCNQGYGSSAALQVAFYTFLEAFSSEKPTCERKEIKGSLCFQSEEQLQLKNKNLGLYNNFTSAVAVANKGVKINCRSKEVSTFEFRDLNILFLLIYPNFQLEVNDRNLIDRRKMELHVAAKLLGLSDIIDATDYHLEVLKKREDPSKEEVIKILRCLGIDEECINEFVEELFYFPKFELNPDDYFYGEHDFYVGDQEPVTENLFGEDMSEASTASVAPTSCMRSEKSKVPEIVKPLKVNYIQQRIAELCEGKICEEKDSPQKICEEINCLGGLDNLSTASDMTVCGKLLRRVRHIVTENMRSLTLSDLTTQMDYEEFGTKLIQSHLSLKVDYEVSSPELDELVQLAIDSENVYGAKMTSGGGTITILHKNVVEELVEKVKKKFGNSFQFYLVFPSSGAKVLNMGVKQNPKSSLSEVLLNRDQLLRNAIQNFEVTFKYRPTYGAFSAGIINLLGDHTNYNLGFCLAMAVNMMTVVVGAFNGSEKIRAATSTDVGEESRKIIFPVPEFKELKPGTINWGKLVKGTVANFKGFIRGFDSMIESNLPFGSGMSSKMALVSAFFTFLEVLHEEKCIRAEEKAYRCMLAVQEFTGIVHGINDHLVAAKSKENFAVLVDCRTTATTLIPFQDPSVTLLITFANVESKINRALLYKRLEECHDVAKALGRRTLRCLTFKDLDNLKYAEKEVPEKSVWRAMHVITENERVLKAAEALKNHDFDTLGELMVESHISLRDKYEMVSPKLDQLVTCAMEIDGVLGAKVPGGFFSGTLSLVKLWAVDDLIEYLQKNASCELTFHLVNPVEGCGSLNMQEQLDKLPSPQFAFEHIFPF